MASVRLIQPSFTAGELSPALWARVDLAKYQSGLKTAVNVFLHPHGGVSNRPGLEFINKAKDGADRVNIIPFEFNTTQSYILEFGDLYMRVYRDGGNVLSGGLPYELVTPYSEADVGHLVYAQEADVMYITNTGYAPRKLSRSADDNWSLDVVLFVPQITAPTISAVTKPGDTSGAGGYVPTVYSYKVSAISDDTGGESLPSAVGSATNDLSIAGGKNRISWSAISGASRYIVYKEDNGVYGYIGGTEGLSFDDENITPDLADTPQKQRNPFNAIGKYPRCVSFVEQRLAFASTNDDPQAVWLSQIANYENFGVSQPAKATDAVTFRIKARQVNEIRAIMPGNGMMLFTSGAEWSVTGGQQSDSITPSAIKISSQGARGMSEVQPLVIGNTTLFAQNRGGVVRDFSYEFASDSFDGKDLTILARHMFEGKEVKSWAFAQSPYSMVWVVLDDGSLVSLTYMKEHDVWGWTRHESQGATFEAVAVVGEGKENVPYFVVRRTINGASVRHIERLHTRKVAEIKDAFFVDSGLTYTGSATATISGLDHLEGEQVVALSNGNVVRNLTVSGGSITLPSETTIAHVGLPMVAKLETLDLDMGQVKGLGTIQGRRASVARVVLRVEKTRGIFVGKADADRSSENLVEYKQRSTEAWNEAIQMYTGDIDIISPWSWDVGGNVWIKQFDPLPMTILAFMPEVTVGG